MAKAKPRTGELTTANFGWVKPTVGSSTDAWGGYINADLDGIDATVNSVSNVANAAYPASNPSSYQTASQVTTSLAPYALTTSLANYLPLAGGVLTGKLTPVSTAGIGGTTTNDNANAGAIGEVMSSVVLSPGVTLTTATAANVASLALTSGDWDVSGEVWLAVGTGGAQAAHGVIGSTSATLPPAPAINSGRTSINAALAVSALQVLSVRPCRLSLTATTPVYLIAYAAFSSGTVTAYGDIWARRAR